MSNNPFDREVWNPRERPYSTDNNFAASYADQALRELMVYFLNSRTSASNDASQANPPTSFFGDSFKARPGGGLSVSLTKGIGFFGDVSNQNTSIGGVFGVNDLSAFKPLVLTQPEVITVPPNATANPRIDLIEVKYREELTDPTNRDVMSAVPPYVFTPNLVNKTLTWLLNGQQGTVTTPSPSTTYIGYVVGTPAASPVAPTPTAGYERVAWIGVAAGAVTITANEIVDWRRTAVPNGVQRASCLVTSTPATQTHAITEVTAPPGVEVSVLDQLSTAGELLALVSFKTGPTKNMVPTFAMKQGSPGIANQIIGSVESVTTIDANGFAVFIRGRVLDPAGPTFGVTNITAPVKTWITVHFEYQ